MSEDGVAKLGEAGLVDAVQLYEEPGKAISEILL